MPINPRQATPSLLQIDSIFVHLSGAPALTEVCRFLRSEFSHFQWLGIYRLDGRTLELAGWDGDKPTEHTSIPIDRGVCGRAAREGRTVIVDDVNADPDYLACFLDTRSEIVVPVRHEGRVVGEIDADGRIPKAFDVSDGRFLEAVAGRIAPALARLGASPP
ncbi:MAG TPA: GAF domain-containing protein [Thermoplasmata archaeon]|nr:GAF domain-containing protein [Thermoplasmata archaeon]